MAGPDDLRTTLTITSGNVKYFHSFWRSYYYFEAHYLQNDMVNVVDIN